MHNAHSLNNAAHKFQVSQSGQEQCRGTQRRCAVDTAVHHVLLFRSAYGNQDDTGKPAGGPVQEADLETVLEQEPPQHRVKESPDSIGDRVQRDVEGIMAEEGGKEEARFPGSGSQPRGNAASAQGAPGTGEHREVPAGQR